MVLTILHHAYKTFNMKFILFLLIFIIANISNAQTIPIGTIIKGKRLPSLYASAGNGGSVSTNILYGAIRLNDSKLSIIETGFVFFENSNQSLPNINNSRRLIVSGGVQDFSIILDDLPPVSMYKIRAYAINSKQEISYSDVFIHTTEENFCYLNPCKNGGTCTSTISGPLCQCTLYFCGDCCARLADDITCFGGADQVCPFISQSEIATSTQFKQIKYFNNIIKPKNGNIIWSLSTNSK